MTCNRCFKNYIRKLHVLSSQHVKRSMFSLRISDQHFGLFTAAQKAWNVVAPEIRNFECRDIEIPLMAEDPREVPILWWLRSERDDSPKSLQSLTLLRWLVGLHNQLLHVAMESAEMHDAIPEPTCLADALQPYFFSYQPGPETFATNWTTFVHHQVLGCLNRNWKHMFPSKS